jgi:hypothetical protein
MGTSREQLERALRERDDVDEIVRYVQTYRKAA